MVVKMIKLFIFAFVLTNSVEANDECFKESITWSTKGMLEFIPLLNFQECTKAFVQNSEAVAFSWFTDFGGYEHICIIFGELEGEQRCKDCLSFEQTGNCACEQEHGQCEITKNNFISASSSQSEVECSIQCSANDKCEYYTWLSKDHDTSYEECLLFSSCDTVNQCNQGCFVGSVKCQLGDVVDVAIEAGNFKTLVQILSDLDLVDTLRHQRAQTIFAPSDEAFAKLPEGTLESLTHHQKLDIVSRHVVAGVTVPAADVSTGPVETFGGEVIDLIKTDDGGVQVSYMSNIVNVVAADVMASNGVIHVIDEVILPGDVVDVAIAAGSFTTLIKLLSDLGLVDALRGATAQTIFAPSDEAFGKLPEGTLESLSSKQALAIVLRHVIGGTTILAADVGLCFNRCPVETLGGEVIYLIKRDEGGIQISYMSKVINVVTVDVMASNGVIHIIDDVILPGDVVDVAIAAGSFKTLVRLLSDLDLVDTFRGATAQTIFAPSDEAFAKLPHGTLDSLTHHQKLEIVLRHVVGGATVLAADVTTGPVDTLGGDSIYLIKNEQGGVQISYEGMNFLINVVTADVTASNGVIHVIDNVIVPLAETK